MVSAVPVLLESRRGRKPRPEARVPAGHPAAEQPRAGRAESEPKELGRRVLVVDDEPSIRLLCAINLKMEGYEVQEAEDGAEALALAADGDFDLILLDVMLPDMGGFDVARSLAARGRAAPPIVFLSARTDRDDLRAAYTVGGVDYITKPFDPTGLAVRVKEILDRVARGESEQYRRARLAELSN
jgi:DNA-binding response OmpR family regulator